MSGPKPKPKRDPLLEMADALESGRLTHEQLIAMNTPDQVAQGTQQDMDLGPVAAAGLGAARGMSFGLSDLVNHFIQSRTDRAATQATAQQHPTASTIGTIAGGALPFALTGGASTLPGLGLRGTQAALGAAQGFGLTSGNVGDRLVGAGFGGATALAAPFLASAGMKVAGRVPIVGGLIRGLTRAAPAAAPAAESVLPSGISEAAARAQLTKMGFQGDALENALAAAKGSGGVPTAAAPVNFAPTAPAPPDPMDIATFLRRQAPAGGTPAAPGGLLSPASAPAPAGGLLSPTPMVPANLPEGLLTPDAQDAALQAIKASRKAARDAARAVYNHAIATGSTKAEATEVATRAAASVSFMHGIHSQNFIPE